jgi:ribonuclease HIII
MANSYTLKLGADTQTEVRAFFKDKGFEFHEAPHAFWNARGPQCNATFYRSGKLLLQGKEADTYRGLLGDDTPAARPFHQGLSLQPKPPPQTWIGTDEAGKGDYLGPLVVAGVLLKREHLEILHTLGVDDSKALSDHRLPEMVRAIEALGPSEVLVLSPPRYNEMYASMGNLNRMLAWAHAKVIESLAAQGDADWIIVDQFEKRGAVSRRVAAAGISLPITERPKGESDPAVAAASVLARAAFLRVLKSLGRRHGVTLRPGAGPPTLASARAFVQAHGREALNEVAKLHFATTGQL